MRKRIVYLHERIQLALLKTCFQVSTILLLLYAPPEEEENVVVCQSIGSLGL